MAKLSMAVVLYLDGEVKHGCGARDAASVVVPRWSRREEGKRPAAKKAPRWSRREDALLGRPWHSVHRGLQDDLRL